MMMMMMMMMMKMMMMMVMMLMMFMMMIIIPIVYSGLHVSQLKAKNIDVQRLEEATEQLRATCEQRHLIHYGFMVLIV